MKKRKAPTGVQFQCDLSGKATPFPHYWEHTVGGDHAPMMLRADCQQQLRRCHEQLGFRHLRFHGLLSDNMGTLITHKEKPLYSFFNADQIWDFLLSIGMKPFIELSLMPRTLASGGKTVFRYNGNVTPPKDYKKWATLIRKLAKHWVDVLVRAVRVRKFLSVPGKRFVFFRCSRTFSVVGPTALTAARSSCSDTPRFFVQYWTS